MKHYLDIPKPWTALLAGLLALQAMGGTLTHAQDWESYPQSGFTPFDIAARPDGSIAYAAGKYQAPGTNTSTPMLRRGDTGGTRWTTLVLPAGVGRINNVTVAPSGRVYFAGIKKLPDGNWPGRVWFSDDRGVTWSETATFLTSAQRIGDMATDAAGNVFMATGSASPYELQPLTTYKGVPDVSAPTGIAWRPVDEQPLGQCAYFPRSLAIRPSGDASKPAEIWVACNVLDVQKPRFLAPVLRHSANGGATWTNLAAWSVPTNYTIYSVGSLTVDRNGHAFVSANYFRKGEIGHGLIYRSTNGGTSWTLVDDMAGYPCHQNAAASYGLNGIIMTGLDLTRASVDGGNTWRTVAAVTGGSCVTGDLAGNLFAGGSVTDGNRTDGCIYKMPAPPLLRSGSFDSRAVVTGESAPRNISFQPGGP